MGEENFNEGDAEFSSIIKKNEKINMESFSTESREQH